MAQFCLHVLLLTLSGVLLSVVHSAATFTIVNKCEFTVWPGISSTSGSETLPTTGFALLVGQTRTIDAPSSWIGRLWGRTLCSKNSTGNFSCVTGDCGSGKIECASGVAAPPATLAEFSLNAKGGLDFYDVSVVDGYNVPMLVVPVPQGGSGANCTATGCVVDLNSTCPSGLLMTSSNGDPVACKSACQDIGQQQSCEPSLYEQVFKRECPRALSSAYDDKSSSFTCSVADYVVTFCPAPNAM